MSDGGDPSRRHTATVPSSGSYYSYRGGVYPALAVAKEWVGLPLIGGVDRFPDAIEVHDGPDEPWVKIPRTALDAAFTRRVDARWNGVLVSVGSVVARGPARGLVSIAYQGSDPDEAVDAGLTGDQHNGWGARVDPSELEVVSDEMVARPVVER